MANIVPLMEDKWTLADAVLPDPSLVAGVVGG